MLKVNGNCIGLYRVNLTENFSGNERVVGPLQPEVNDSGIHCITLNASQIEENENYTGTLEMLDSTHTLMTIMSFSESMAPLLIIMCAVGFEL